MLLPELGTFLVGQNIAGITALDVDTFLGRTPGAPDAVLVLMPYGALPDEADLGKKQTRLEFPRVQALCRGAKDDFAGPWAMAAAVKKAFMTIENQNLSGVFYQAVLAESGPFFIRRDLNDRVEIVTNFQVTKAPSAS